MRRRKDWLSLLLIFMPLVYGNVYDAAPIGWQQPRQQFAQPGRLPPRSPMTRGYQAPPPPLIFTAPRSYQASYYQGPASPQRTQYANNRPQTQYNYAPAQQLHHNPIAPAPVARPPPLMGPPRYETGYNEREHKERQQEAEWMVQMLTYQDKKNGYKVPVASPTTGYPAPPQYKVQPEQEYGSEPESSRPQEPSVKVNQSVNNAQPALTQSGYASSEQYGENTQYSPAPNPYSQANTAQQQEVKTQIDNAPSRIPTGPTPPRTMPGQKEVSPTMPVPAPNAPHRLIFTPKSVHHFRPSESMPPAFYPTNYNQPSHSPSYQNLHVMPATLQRQVHPSQGFRPANGGNKNPPDVVNDIIVHIYLNAKERVSHSAAKIGPIHGLFGIGTSHGGPGTHTNPIVITKDFDRERLKFVDRNMADEMMEEGPTNIVEVKAMVSTPDSSPDRRIKETLNRAVDKELDRAIPVVLNRFHGSMTAIDNDLRKELEQALVDEIAKNLGETIDDMSNVSEEDLAKLIEEGFNEATESPKPTTIAVTSASTGPVIIQTTRKPATTTERTTRTPETRPTETITTRTTPSRTRPTEPLTEPTLPTEPSTQPTVARTRPTAAPTPSTEAPTRPSPEVTHRVEPAETRPPPTVRVTEARTRPTVPTTVSTTETPTTESTTTVRIRTRPTPRVLETTRKIVTTESTTVSTTSEAPEEITEAPRKTERPWWMITKTEAPRAEVTQTRRPPVQETTLVPTVTPKVASRPTERPTTTEGVPEPPVTSVETTRKPTTVTESPQLVTVAPKQNRPPVGEEEEPIDDHVQHYTPPAPIPRKEEFGQEFEQPHVTETLPKETTKQARLKSTWAPVTPTTEAHTVRASAETTRPAPTSTVSAAQPTTTTTEKPTTTPEKEQKLPFDFNQENIPETHTIDESESKSMELSPSAVTTLRPTNFAGENMGEGLKSEEERVTVPIPTEEEEKRIQTLTPPSATSEENSFEDGVAGPLVTTKPIHIVHLDSNEVDEEATTTTTTSPPNTQQTPTQPKITPSTTSPTMTAGGPGTSVIFSSREEPSKHPLKEKEESEERQPSIQSTKSTTHMAIFDESAFEGHTIATSTMSTTAPATTEKAKMITFTPPTAIHSKEEEAESGRSPTAEETGRGLTKAPPSSFGEMNINRAPITENGDDTGRKTLEEVSSSAENEAPESLNTPKGSCPTPNDSSDTNRSDVVFLLDSSNSFTEDKFMHSITLILHTVDQFKNIGPDGVQVSLVQFSNEPYLEFSLRKHNCKQWLKDDIANTEYMNGSPMLGKALDKVSRFAFTKRRGDRSDAENILVILTDGQSDDRIQQPVQVARENNVTVMVIATLEADPAYLMNLTGDMDNVFHVDSASPNQPLADKLAQRIRNIAKPQEEEVSASTDEESTIHIHNHPSTIDNNVLEKEEPTENKEEKPVKEAEDEHQVKMKCTFNSFQIDVTVPGEFYGLLSVKGREQDEQCSHQVRPKAFDVNQTVTIEVPFDSCGVTRVKSDAPQGLNNTLILQLQHDPSLRTDEDKAFLLQCSVPLKTEAEIQTNIEVINSEIIIAEMISLSSIPPKCNYSIRVEDENGPIIQRVSVGQIIYHKWECDDTPDSNNVYGMKIHDCFASNDVEQKYPIIGKAGCSSDLAVLSDPVYSDDKLSAYAISHAFGFQHTESLKFVCKLSLCTRDGDGCEGVTPPQCSSNSTNVLLSRRVPGNTSSIDRALTSALSTQIAMNDKGLSDFHSGVASVVESKITWLAAGIILMAIVLTILAMAYKQDNWDSSTTSSSSDVEMSGNSTRLGSIMDIHASRSTVPTVSGPTTDMRPTLSRDFLNSFDRSKYV